jgi:eukaryotic-like serine/threonine-protein kinase
VHRDLKPENILVSDDQARVADFGVAKALAGSGDGVLTETGLAVGTPAYMSPEQGSGGAVDARSDIYALGCLLYEMLAGEPPYTGPTPLAIALRRFTDPVPSVRRTRPSVPSAVEEVIGRALAPVPADRFATAREVAERLAHLPTGSMDPTGSSQAAQVPPRKRRSFAQLGLAAVGGLAVLAVVILAALLLWSTAERSPARVSRPTDTHRIAVLYFENLSADSQDNYLTQGLTEEVTSRLSDVPRFQVAGRNTVRRFRDAANPGATTIGRLLDVDYLVEGSVRRSGPTLRVSVRLLNARDGFRVWSADYNRSMADLLNLQEEVARQVATSIAGRLIPAELGRLRPRPTDDPEAYDHFLRGNFYLGLRTSEGGWRAAEEYMNAVQRDSVFVTALARLAYTHALAGVWGWVLPDQRSRLTPEELWADGLALADRAIHLDSTASDAWLARGYLLHLRGGRRLPPEGGSSTGAEVRQAFDRALSLDLKNAEVHHQYGSVLTDMGDPADAALHLERALQLDPARPMSLIELAWLQVIDGGLLRAARLLDSAVALAPQNARAAIDRAEVQLRLGDTAAAHLGASIAPQLDTTSRGKVARASIVGLIALLRGDSMEARTYAGQAAQLLNEDSYNSFETTRLYVELLSGLGERGRALDTFERALGTLQRPRHAWLHFSWPSTLDLRELPRYRVLSKTYGQEGAM